MNDTPSKTERVRSYLQDLVADSKTPGIQYLALESAGTLFEYAGGWADIRRRVPMDSATTMMAYSMSKTITAAAVLQLVEARKVGLDDPIDQYVNCSPYGSTVTVRELLAHTSGIPNPIPLRWVHLAAHHERFDETAALAAVLRKHPRLSFQPGTKYAYSNIGYWLLGPIVERASGQPFTSYVTKSVLGPLGVSSSELGYAIPDNAGHASGYLEKYSLMNVARRFLIDGEFIGDYEGPWLRIKSHYLNGPAFGGLVGTASGFGKFLRDQLRHDSVLFNGTTRSLFYAAQRTMRGIAVEMTLGWHVGSRHGSPFFYKEGGGGGFHSMMRLYPTHALATIVIVNATGFNVSNVLNTLDPHFCIGRRSRILQLA